MWTKIGRVCKETLRKFAKCLQNNPETGGHGVVKIPSLWGYTLLKLEDSYLWKTFLTLTVLKNSN